MERRWLYLVYVFLTCLVCRGIAFDDDNLFWCYANNFVFMNTTKQWLSGSTDVYYSTVSFSHGNAVLSASSYLYRKDYLVFSDKGTRTIFLYKDKPVGQGVFAHVGVSEGIGELAVDWVNFNVYWCDGIYSWIGLQALPRDITRVDSNNDKQRIIVEKALVKPYGIAVSPSQRFIFWTDYGARPRIERASLSGKNRRTLIWMGLKKPMAITVDPNTDKLFWIDHARATIETCDFDGHRRLKLLQRLGYSLTSVTVFGEHLLYTEAKNTSIHAVSKITGSQSARDLVIHAQSVGVSVFTKLLQPFTSSACDTHGCSHICVQESGGPTCLCEGGFNLAVGGKTCSATSTSELWKNILYSTGDQICSVPVTTLNSYAYTSVKGTCLTTDDYITFLVPDAQSSTVFYSSGKSVKRKVIGGGTQTVATTSNEITGLVLDPIEKDVIWTESTVGVIRKATVGINSTPSDVFTGLRSPAALTIAVKTRKLFWISSTSPARIETGNVAGGDAAVLVGSDLRQPVRLTFDQLRNRLYWTEDGRIGSILADGRMRMNYPHNPLPSYIGIMVFKDYLVWSMNEQTANMTSAVITDKGGIKTPVTFPIPGTVAVNDLAVYDTDSNPGDISGCDDNNGGCQQICLPNDDTHLCQCNLGFKLQTDLKTCSSAVVDSDFYLVLDDVHNSMYQVVTNDVVHGVGILTENTPSIITYDTRRRKVLWYDAVRGLISKANLDGTEESVVIGTETMVVQDVAVDPSTSNIYYTVTSPDGGSGSVRVVTHDGITRKTLIQSTGKPGPLAINPKSGLLIWGEGSVIKMADMSGSGVSTLISSGLTSVTDLDIDTDGEVLYVADSVGDKLESVVLQTRSRKQLRQNTQEFPSAIAVKGDNLNYLTKAGRSIKVIHKKTGGELLAVADVAEFGRLRALYVYTDGDAIANRLCSNSNGDCSTLCLPTSSGRKCACADGLSLKDQKVCEQAIKCPEALLHGTLASNCSPYVNNVCSYSCDDGYETKISTSILCSKTGVWNTSLDKLCVETPYPVGTVVGACAGAVVVIVVLVLIVFCLKRRASTPRRPQITATPSKEPIITVTDTCDQELYDEIGHPQNERYLSFSRISPNSPRRNLGEISEINNPSYISSSHAQYLTATLELNPLTPPRPKWSLTPNTQTFRSESPAPDYETPISESPAASYIDLSNYQDQIP